MKIKTYQGKTEKDTMLKVKEELGKDALIVNVKKVKPRGIFKLLRRTYVEVTAAIDEVETRKVLGFEEQLNNVIEKEENKVTNYDSNTDLFAQREEEGDNDLKNKIKNTNEPSEIYQLIYNQLFNNEVDEKVINGIFRELKQTIDSSENISFILNEFYEKIVCRIGEVKTIELQEEGPKLVFFVGATGVGKTTTIAKIASHFIINENKKVGLITSDTYRIAAVEQLRTYANILCTSLEVVYSKEELEKAVSNFSNMDLILVDTAGRSHKNEKHFNELKNLLNIEREKEVYLVLSATTKYNDLKKIVDKYSKEIKYNIIFTKLDETNTFGNILNIKEITKADLSYTTYGQNVPGDIEKLKPQEIAKNLLGGVN